MILTIVQEMEQDVFMDIGPTNIIVQKLSKLINEKLKELCLKF